MGYFEHSFGIRIISLKAYFVMLMPSFVESTTAYNATTFSGWPLIFVLVDVYILFVFLCIFVMRLFHVMEVVHDLS